MAMFGMPLQGAFEVHCSGHHHNNMFLRHLQAEASYYLDIVRESEMAAEEDEVMGVPALAMPA